MDKNTQDRPVEGFGRASASAWIAWIMTGFFILAGLFVISRYNYLLFHTLVEMFSIAVAWSVFMLVWNARGFLKNDALLSLGAAYLFIGFLDLLHTLAYQGMGVFAEHWGANLPTQLWIAARYMEAAALLTFVLLLGRRVRFALPLAGWTGIAGLLILAIFAWRIFPDCFVDGVGLTPFKIGSEYLICLVLAAAMVLLRQRREMIDSVDKCFHRDLALLDRIDDIPHFIHQSQHLCWRKCGEIVSFFDAVSVFEQDQVRSSNNTVSKLFSFVLFE